MPDTNPIDPVPAYMDTYLQNLNFLPAEITRQYRLMELLDERCQKLLTDADRLAAELLARMRAGTADASRVSADKASVALLYGKANAMADDKFQVAVLVYDMVDKFVQRLDKNLCMYKEDVAKSLARSDISVPAGLTQPGQPAIAHLSNILKHLAQIQTRVKQEGTVTVDGDSWKTASRDDLDVDPNEPKFCMCQQVSFGLMVACDGAMCPYDWFHYQCVGLTEKPTGRWLCAICANE